MPRHPKYWLTAILLTFALVAGCSSDDDNPAGGGSTDTTPPGVASVTALDAGHIEVVFNENVQRASAENTGNYLIIESSTPLGGFQTDAPGDTLAVAGASLGTDQKTVTLSTFTMGANPYDMSVAGVKDASGNTINTPVQKSFTGSADPDATPPQLVYRSPAPNATNVAVGVQILLTFSESITYDSFINGFTISAGAGNLPFSADSEDNGVHVVITLLSPLDLGTEYTVTLSGIEDGSSNTMADVTWTFRTTNTADVTPPTIVSTSPANGALNVATDTDLTITFSEPINQSVLNASTYPEIGDGTPVFSNGGKTLTFTPAVPLADDTQYTITFLPGSYIDLSGNPNETSNVVKFSTGAALAAGSFTGTIDGDPNSADAQDPTGGRVFAVVGPLTTIEDTQFAGSVLVAGNNTFDMRNLPDGDYTSITVLDSNGDGLYDPEMGDALGGYGVDFSIPDTELDPITITGGNRVTGIDYQIWDFAAIAGSVSYSGIYAGEFHMVGVGLFSTVGFDPANPPDYATEAYWSDYPYWNFWQLDYEFPDGSYYVGAFLDANDNFTLDPGDPVGFYGGLPTPTAINVLDGSDRLGIVIPISDPPVPPSPSSAGPSIVWHKSTKHAAPWVHNVAAAIRKEEQKKQW